MHLQGKKIFLRSVLTSDADLLYKWENDKSNWQVSGTRKPFTKKEIKNFVLNQKDIYLDRQLRFMICIFLNPPVGREPRIEAGCIDLFDFDPKNVKAGVGILIEKIHRRKGYASEALEMLIHYSFNTINLHELYCNISEDNSASMRIFQKHKFKVAQTQKGLHFLQLINK